MTSFRLRHGPRCQPRYSKCCSMSLLLTSRAYLWITSSVSLMWVAHQESKLLIWLHLSARLVNRDQDIIATTDVHRRLVWVHAQRSRKGLQAKQSESLHTQDSAMQKPDQNRNNMSHSLYNQPSAPNHISTSKLNIPQLWSQHLQSVSHNTPLISCKNIDW